MSAQKMNTFAFTPLTLFSNSDECLLYYSPQKNLSCAQGSLDILRDQLLKGNCLDNNKLLVEDFYL